MSRRFLVLTVACLTVAGSQLLVAQSDEAERVRKAATVLEEIMSAPDKAIPNSVIKKAEAIAVFPGTLKGGLGVGAHHGKGILSVRHRDAGKWSNPGVSHDHGRQLRRADRRRADRLVLVVLNKERHGKAAAERVQDRRRCVGGGGPGRPRNRGLHRHPDDRGDSQLLTRRRPVRGRFARRLLDTRGEDANQRYYGRPLHNREITGLAARPLGRAVRPSPPVPTPGSTCSTSTRSRASSGGGLTAYNSDDA